MLTSGGTDGAREANPVVNGVTGQGGRRADAGSIRLGERDTIHAILTDTTPDDITAILATLHPSPEASDPDSPQTGRDPATTSRATAAPKVSFHPPITRPSLRVSGANRPARRDPASGLPAW
jgi:hypothetical protein